MGANVNEHAVNAAISLSFSNARIRWNRPMMLRILIKNIMILTMKIYSPNNLCTWAIDHCINGNSDLNKLPFSP